MRIIKFFKTFSKKVDIYPTPVPVLLSPENLAKLTREEAEKTVSKWEKGWARKNEQDKINFEPALVRMTMCFSLNNMGKSFTLFGRNKKDYEHTNCYSWCPYDEWFVNNEKFIDSFEMYRKENSSSAS